MNNNDEREGKELHVMTLKVLYMHRFFLFVYLDFRARILCNNLQEGD
jgi:hypothetical protein